MTRVALVLNPVGVDGADALADRLHRRCTDLGWEPPLVLETTAEDPGRGMTRQALDAGVDRVVVAGGDGTVRTVAAALLGSGTPLGVVPSGTGNLLARNLDLPLDADEALEIALTGPVRQLDAGRAEGLGAFVVMAGMGLDAAMMEEAPDALKARVGWPAYLVGGARALRRGRFTVHVSVDGSAPIRRRVSTVLVGNVGSLQGGLALLPEARPDDGLLDVCLVAPASPLEWLAVLGRLVLHRPPRRDDARLERLRGRRIRIRSTQRRPRQVDGDPIDEGAALDADVVPAGLLVASPPAPAEAPPPPEVDAVEPGQSASAQARA